MEKYIQISLQPAFLNQQERRLIRAAKVVRDGIPFAETRLDDVTGKIQTFYGFDLGEERVEECPRGDISYYENVDDYGSYCHPPIYNSDEKYYRHSMDYRPPHLLASKIREEIKRMKIACNFFRSAAWT